MARGRTVQQLRSVADVTKVATSRALNRVGQTVLRRTLQILSEDVGLSQTRLRQYVRLVRANISRLATAVAVTPHTFNIASFPGTRQIKSSGKVVFSFMRNGRRHNVRAKSGSAVGVSSSAWGKRRIYPGTFLIHGGRTAMKRVGKARLPIEPVYGPRVHREFTYPETISELESVTAERMPIEMKHEIDYALKQSLK